MYDSKSKAAVQKSKLYLFEVTSIQTYFIVTVNYNQE